MKTYLGSAKGSAVAAWFHPNGRASFLAGSFNSGFQVDGGGAEIDWLKAKSAEEAIGVSPCFKTRKEKPVQIRPICLICVPITAKSATFARFLKKAPSITHSPNRTCTQ